MFLKNQKSSIFVSLPNKKQEIVIGNGLTSWAVEELLRKDYSSFIIFCDANFVKIHHNLFLELKRKLNPAEVILIEPSENSKSLDFLNFSLERCAKVGLNRKTCFIALGGGIVGDITGFLASVYMRGVDMVFIPTTLMAQGDTIINKVAISYKLLKNIIGSFYSPCLTVCDTDFLQSLSDREISLGLSEIIKHALISSKSFTKYLTGALSTGLSNWKTYDWNKIILQSLKVKGMLVAKDPYDEQEIHKGLSYGHTFANAFEGLSGFNLRHGEAVALGMRMSGYISRTSGFLNSEDFEIQERLLNVAGLPSKLPHRVDHEHIISYLKRDKISSKAGINLVILEKIGKFRVIKGVNENVIRDALTEVLL